jgi:hypothetical protein
LDSPYPALASMQRTKGPTARWAKELLGRVGKPFWQEEYFDRLVRSAAEFKQIRRYIELNPVKAGLVAHPWEFPWSSTCGRESGSEESVATRFFQLRLAATPCVSPRLPSSVPIGSFHPIRFCPCWAHPARAQVRPPLSH